jgi:hypothetical protein
MGKERKTVTEPNKLFGVTPWNRVRMRNKKEFGAIDALRADAISYIQGFRWCHGVHSVYLGQAVGGIFGVFLVEITNAVDSSESFLWVIVGDIPPAYLVTKDGPSNSREALAMYIDLMGEWVKAAKEGGPVGDLIPVNVTPNVEYAEMLETRIKYLQDNFL